MKATDEYPHRCVDTKLDYTVHVFSSDMQVLLSMGLLEWSARTARGLK